MALLLNEQKYKSATQEKFHREPKDRTQKRTELVIGPAKETENNYMFMYIVRGKLIVVKEGLM